MKNMSLNPQTERLVSQVKTLETELLTELNRLYEAAHEPVDASVVLKLNALSNLAIVRGGYSE
jgi:hypothetical protein